jgi:NAD(P)-dependent dehydrogenase (short-subunit alcohol dehydrogenase family)
MNELKNKIVIVTGSGRGIGQGIALRLAKEGMQIIIAERNRQDGERTASAICNAGHHALFLETDVTSPSSVDQCVSETIRRFGQVDGLVNNAAVSLGKSFLDTSFDLWKQTLDINLTGVFLMSQAVAKHMIHNSSRSRTIVNISSLNAVAAEKNNCSYVASKGAVTQLTKAMAVDLASYGVRVNSLELGPVMTSITVLILKLNLSKPLLPKDFSVTVLALPLTLRVPSSFFFPAIHPM